MIKINTKYLISFLVIILVLILINQYTKIIENNENNENNEKADEDKEKAAEDLVLINNIKT